MENKDKTHVVVVGDDRVTGVMDEGAAKQEADRRNRLNEAKGGDPSQNAKVKQNLLG